MRDNIKEKLENYKDAGFPILYINSFEEEKVDQIINEISRDKAVLEWNGASNGLLDFKTKELITTVDSQVSYYKSNSILEEVLKITIKDDAKKVNLNNKLLVIKDMHTLLNDPGVVAILKEIVMQINKGMEATIIMVSSVLNIPKELEKYIIVLEMDYLDKSEIKNIIIDFTKENDYEIGESLLNEMVTAFKGLSEFEIKSILALALAQDGEITRKDLHLVFEQKQQMIKKAGIIEMVQLKETDKIDDIGGLENLKQWIQRKAEVIKNIDQAIKFGVDIPKGILIAGVPGCGKSLNAKAVAKLFEVPLLRLDIGRLMGKYLGESEANMRKAIALAEAVSPCVLWIDELEKAFAGISGDGGGAEVTTRLLGNFLTWMQEKNSLAFVVATANNITKLPPELLRKGRFDEIFYVGLPNREERKKIFEIHINRRRPEDLNKIDISKLVSETDGYSGADIEGVVKESIESAFADRKDKLTTEDILSTIRNTHSLSEIMGEEIKKMSDEYEKRRFKNASN